MYTCRGLCQTEATEPTEIAILPSFLPLTVLLPHPIVVYLHVCVYFVGKTNMHFVQS